MLREYIYYFQQKQFYNNSHDDSSTSEEAVTYEVNSGAVTIPAGTNPVWAHTCGDETKEESSHT
jgi:hypothetical protein